MSSVNGDQSVKDQELAAECDVLRRRILELESQLVEVIRERDAAQADVREYEKMYRLWDVEGIAPPRRRELEEALQNGVGMEQIVSEIEKMVQSRSHEA